MHSQVKWIVSAMHLTTATTISTHLDDFDFTNYIERHPCDEEEMLINVVEVLLSVRRPLMQLLATADGGCRTRLITLVHARNLCD